uniref:Uncharacterized protein n=1 Tax=Gervais tombus-like virus TaxID=2716733 RepID=A0A6G7PS38_9TOMB|nr:putative protein 2 [Gervais tombus-like virus]
MSTQTKVACAHGTIAYAMALIEKHRKRCGLASINGGIVERFRSLAGAIKQGWDGSDRPLPAKILNTAVNIAGLPYGIFGVKAMRPIKRDF